MRKKLKKSKQSEKRWRFDLPMSYNVLLEEISEGVMLTDDRTTEILYANSAALKLLGLKGANLHKVKLFELVHPEDKQEVKKYYEILKKKKKLTTERRIKGKDGKYIVVERKARILPNGKVISTLRDVSRDKEAERRKNLFMSMVSHELNTPVTSMSLYLEILQSKLEGADNAENAYHEEVVRLVKLARGKVSKQVMLINDLLDMTKIGFGKFGLKKEMFDFDELVKKNVDQANSIFKSRHVFKLEGKVKSPVFGDPDRMEQVLVNLFSNAIKYSPLAEQVVVTVSGKGGKVMVKVKDFGIGIEKKEQRKIFTRFFRSSGEREKTFPGLGIGLYLSREIVRAHKGKLTLESAPGQGSTFTVTLPVKGE